MPVSTAVDLYLAKSVGELNTKAEIPNKTVIPKVYVKTAEKLIADANRCSNLGDEEKAYVLYMRYFNIITLIKKTADYKKQKEYYDSLIGKKNLLQAIEKAESLSKSLTNRYELREAEAVSKKLEALGAEREKKKQEQEEAEKKEKEVKEKEKEKEKQETNGAEKSLFSSCGLSASGLYQLLQTSPDEVIVMDTRSVSEFADSHLQHKSVINVPVDIITPGITVPRIETSLPPEARELWDKRAQVEYIVLMDWNSTIDKVGPGKTLQTLKDALFKFDSKTIIKSEPLILEGGYDDWCLYYPAMTTHPVLDRPLYTPVSNIPSLDFDYPDLDAAFIQTPSPQVKPTNGTAAGDRVIQSESAPSVVQPAQQKVRPYIPDRAKKPTFSSQSSLERLNNDLGRTEKSVSSTTSRNNFLENSGQPSNTIVTQRSKSNLVAEQERELATLQSLKNQKEKELEQFQRDKQRLLLEHKARLEQLKTRQAEIAQLERMKHQQEKDVADLMRMKRKLEDDMKMEKRNEEEEQRAKAEEESRRQAELERMSQEEEDRIARLRLVEESRNQRKLKEESEKLRQENLRKEEEAANVAEAEKKRLEALEVERKKEEVRKREEEDRKNTEEEKELARKNEEAKLELQKQESQRKMEEERKRREEIRQKQEREREELKKREEERKKRLEEQKEAEDRERREQERLRVEKLEQERKEKEKLEREKAEEAKRIAQEHTRRLEERKTRPTTSTMLPVGWERRLDGNTNRYFYLNHNDGTSQWDPPQMNSVTSSPVHGKVYKTKLRDEDSGGRSSNLVRSHSSPNIAQLVEEEQNSLGQTPNFNRGAKPTIKPLVSQSTVNANRTVNVKAARMRDLNPVYGSVGAGLTGLRNLGNTCYMNSTLQCLNNCFPLVSYFLNDNYLDDMNRESKFSYNGEVVDEFAVIMKALWQKQYRSICARDFKIVCSRYNSLFANSDHQDSQEFLAFLLDGLHEGLNRIKSRPKIQELDTDNMPDVVAAEKSWANHKLHNQSIIVELFQGVLKSTVTCLTCRKRSTRFDVFQYLTLPLPRSNSACTIQDCLRLFLGEEKLTGSSRWKCPRCKVDREAVKKLDIWKLPHILIIHLNRFFNEGMWREKMSGYVDFPVNSMDLDNIVAGPRKRKPYNLYAVANHYGTMEGGHYTAYGKNPGTGDWHKFDDHEVHSMSQKDVKTSAAYFLFYTSI